MIMDQEDDEKFLEIQIEKIFRQMDVDGLGRLSLERFVEGAKTDPNVCMLFESVPVVASPRLGFSARLGLR